MKTHSAQRTVMAREHLTQPGGGGKFPIPNREYLRKAIAAYGRSNTPDATKAWIISRAHALDATDMLPEAWGVGKAAAAKTMAMRRSKS